MSSNQRNTVLAAPDDGVARELAVTVLGSLPQPAAVGSGLLISSAPAGSDRTRA